MGCGRSCCLGQLVGGGSRGWHGGTAAQGVQAVLHERLAASAGRRPPPPRAARQWPPDNRRGAERWKASLGGTGRQRQQKLSLRPWPCPGGLAALALPRTPRPDTATPQLVPTRDETAGLVGTEVGNPRLGVVPTASAPVTPGALPAAGSAEREVRPSGGSCTGRNPRDSIWRGANSRCWKVGRAAATWWCGRVATEANAPGVTPDFGEPALVGVVWADPQRAPHWCFLGACNSGR